MSRCGTRFIDKGLSPQDRDALDQLKGLAARLAAQSKAIADAVAFCLHHETTEGLSEMVAYSFNAQQHTPQYGGGGGLPANADGTPARYKVIIAGSAPVDTKDNFGNVVGGYLAFELQCIEGPFSGTKQIDRLNLFHKKQQVVEIANKQLSAYCHVVGKFQFADTAELHGIPFMIEVGLQTGENANKYTEVKKIFDINGNEPGKAGGGAPVNAGAAPQPPANQPPPAGVQAQGNGWGGPAAGQPDQTQAGQQWGGQGQGGQAPQQGGGWGGQAPQQGGQPQGGGAAGWGQQGGGQPQQGGNPGWGAPTQGGGQPGWGQQG